MRRWSGSLAVAVVLLVGACHDEPVAPAPSFGRQPPPPPLSGLAPIDLDEGMVRSHHGYGINDSGWVFVLSVKGDGSWDGLVWLTLTPHDSTVLPGAVTQPQGGNGRGDYITYWAKVMLFGADGWTLGPRLYAPAGWPDTAKGISTGVQMIAINDARLVVGYAKDPNRSLYSSPVAWIYDEATGNWTPFAMSVPASSNPTSCEVTGVYPQAVNDAGMVVGYATEKALLRKAVCLRRAIVWETVTGPATVLPMAGTLVGYNYSVKDINDRGDITGTAYSGSDNRAVRWWAGTGTVEVLNGYYASGEAIDECGRVLAYQGYVWETDGSVVRQLVAPAGFTTPRVRDIARGVAVGHAYHSTLGLHALVWQLSACTPAP